MKFAAVHYAPDSDKANGANPDIVCIINVCLTYHGAKQSAVSIYRDKSAGKVPCEIWEFDNGVFKSVSHFERRRARHTREVKTALNYESGRNSGILAERARK